MEHLLNLLWLVVVLLLGLFVARAHHYGHLRCSLSVTVGCVAVLALILLPALSMTDDLQRAKLDVENSVRCLGASLLLDSQSDLQMDTGILEAALLLVMIAVARRGSLRIPQRSDMAPSRVRLSSFRPEAVRPPPALA